MIITAMSRLYAERISSDIILPHAIISIGEPKQCKDERLNRAEFADNEHRKGVLYLQFYDIDVDSITNAGYILEIKKIKTEFGSGLMTDDHANSIIEFYQEMLGKIEILICHCEAGVSRSSGVAAALMRIHTGSDDKIFNDSRYIPNRFVYRKILNAWEERRAEK